MARATIDVDVTGLSESLMLMTERALMLLGVPLDATLIEYRHPNGAYRIVVDGVPCHETWLHWEGLKVTARERWLVDPERFRRATCDTSDTTDTA